MKHPSECNSLDEIRLEIDKTDRELIQILRIRYDYVLEATKYKKDEQSVLAPDRHDVMRKQRRKTAREFDIDVDFIEQVYDVLLNYYTKTQLEYWRKKFTP